VLVINALINSSNKSYLSSNDILLNLNSRVVLMKSSPFYCFLYNPRLIKRDLKCSLNANFADHNKNNNNKLVLNKFLKVAKFVVTCSKSVIIINKAVN
jgi:hypothetical protein